MSKSTNLEELAITLEQSKSYRVLRKLQVPQFNESSSRKAAKTGILVDVETTGLEPTADEVIELALIRFRYSMEGNISTIVDSFDQLRQPSKQFLML